MLCNVFAPLRLVAFVLTFALSFQATGLVVAASTTIPSLRHDRVLGTLASTSVMRERVRAHQDRLERAGHLLALTPDEYRAWLDAILNSPSLAYVELPHHLNVMTGYSQRRGVYAIHDVDIPTSYGWEVDLAERGRTLALYIPSDCGNLALLKKPARVLALATPRPPLPSPFRTIRPIVSAASITPPPVAAATPLPIPTALPVAVVHRSNAPLFAGIAAAVGAGIYLITKNCTCPSPPPGFEYISGTCKTRIGL